MFVSYDEKKNKLLHWYSKFERPISSAALIAGFLFDILTLRRVDALWDNIWIGAHLLIVSACILLISRFENEGANAVADAKDPKKLHFWLITILQFFFGGLLSTFLVFYFRSAVFSVAWPFLLILAIAFFANERFKHHYARLYFQISFLFFSVFLFAIYIVPVIVHQIGSGIFIASGIISLVLIGIFLALLRRFSREKFAAHAKPLFASIMAIFALINVLYFTHVIPPLPISLADAGVYHYVFRNPNGSYTIMDEREGFFQKLESYFTPYPAYHAQSGEGVYAYTAIFSPTNLNVQVFDKWEKYDPTLKKWTTFGIIPLYIYGGADNGYHTYSFVRNISAGRWRVIVETGNNQVLGELKFTVVTGTIPVLEIETR